MFQKKKYLKGADSDESSRYMQMWEQFIQVSYKIVDPIVYSMFRESIFVTFDRKNNIVSIKMLKKFAIFHDLFAQHKKDYQPLLDRCFQARVMLVVDFYQEEQRPIVRLDKQVISEQNRQVITTKIKKVVSEKLDISDTKKWELTHTLLKHFGGTISEMGKDTHEQDA